MEKVVILGAGSWGTALALVLAKKGLSVTMWEHRKEIADKLNSERENTRLLPGVKFPENLKITSELEGILDGIKFVVFSVPSQVLRSVILKVSSQISEDMILINTAKGIEISSGETLSNVIKDEIKGKFHKNIVVLSGPTHAEEVAKEMPTAIVATGEMENVKKVQELFNTKYFRVYIGQDIIGAEIGGAVKNCLAIGAGMSDGLGYGDNAKAALITRGIAEMIRFGKAMGAKEMTFSGLTGIGDLVVTCASKHSRNRHVGEELGKGKSIEEVLGEMIMVAEGVATVKAVYNKKVELGINMPIVKAIYQIIYEGADTREKVNELMTRELKEEFY